MTTCSIVEGIDVVVVVVVGETAETGGAARGVAVALSEDSLLLVELIVDSVFSWSDFGRPLLLLLLLFSLAIALTAVHQS